MEVILRECEKKAKDEKWMACTDRWRSSTYHRIQHGPPEEVQIQGFVITLYKQQFWPKGVLTA